MRCIPLKTLSITNPADGKEFPPLVYAITIKSLLENSAGQGLSLDKIRKFLGIINAVETADGAEVVLLEEDQYALLSSIVASYDKWLLPSQAIVDFCDDILNAEQIDPNKAKA